MKRSSINILSLSLMQFSTLFCLATAALALPNPIPSSSPSEENAFFSGLGDVSLSEASALPDGDAAASVEVSENFLFGGGFFNPFFGGFGFFNPFFGGFGLGLGGVVV